MLVGRCLNANPTIPTSRSKACPQRCCAFASSTGHQQPQVAQAAARISTTSEVCQQGIVAPVAGHLSGLFQLLEGPRTELSAQAQLNERLTRCTSWQELAALFEANLDILDFVNISTTWTRLANLFKPTGSSKQDGKAAAAAPPVEQPSFRRFLATLIDVTSQQLRLFGVQALANVMWALSNADWRLDQHEPALSKFLQDWCTAVHDRLPELRAPDVSNISTAIGRLDHRWRSDFVVDFYRSVLQREDLLAHVDLTTLNNLLYGMSRARRRRLTHMGPSTRQLLGQCVDRLLERQDRESTGLVPWRAAQLLYNCHKLKLRVRPNSYAVLMPLVAEVYSQHEQSPNAMDRWSIGFLTAFVDAHRNVHPAVRPDMRPLYAYVERRMPEASTSQLAMLSHAFQEMGCPPPTAFWGQLFARYVAAPPQHAGAAPGQPHYQPEYVTQFHSQQRRQHVPGQLEQLQRGVDLIDERGPSLPSAAQQQRPEQEQQFQPRGQLHQRRQLDSSSVQFLAPPVGSAVPPQRQQQQEQEPPAVLSPRHQLELHVQAQVQHHQQQAAQALQQQRGDRVAWGDPLGRGLEPHRFAQGFRASQVPQPHNTAHQFRQSPHSPQHLRRPLEQARFSGADDGPLQPSAQQRHLQQQQQPSQPTPSQPESPAAAATAWAVDMRESQSLPVQHQQQLHQPQPQQQQQRPHHPPGPQSHPPRATLAQTSPPQPCQQAGQQQPLPDLTAATPELTTAAPRAGTMTATSAVPWRDGAGSAAAVALSAREDDDFAQPRTLHYVCWQAAKAGILPPRAFLRLYVERVPQWLLRSADDKQLAQAVETLKLLRWVPRRELRETLCAALERRASGSRLPLRSLLRWVRQQR